MVLWAGFDSVATFRDCSRPARFGQNTRIDEMPRFLVAKIIIIFLFLVVFYFGIAGLKSGEIRSRGYKFNRDENPIGYWFTIVITLVGPVAIIYLLLTR